LVNTVAVLEKAELEPRCGEKETGVADRAAEAPLPRICFGTTIVGTMAGVFL
jgi:hypothetical protein